MEVIVCKNERNDCFDDDFYQPNCTQLNTRKNIYRFWILHENKCIKLAEKRCSLCTKKLIKIISFYLIYLNSIFIELSYQCSDLARMSVVLFFCLLIPIEILDVNKEHFWYNLIAEDR